MLTKSHGLWWWTSSVYYAINYFSHDPTCSTICAATAATVILKAIIIEPKIGPENRKYTQTPEYTQGGIFGYYPRRTDIVRLFHLYNYIHAIFTVISSCCVLYYDNIIILNWIYQNQFFCYNQKSMIFTLFYNLVSILSFNFHKRFKEVGAWPERFQP